MVYDKIGMFSCIEFGCEDDCCRYGVDILPEEYIKLISDNKASHTDFIGPRSSGNGEFIYRTRVGLRGCIFLLPRRGCRFHGTDYKPITCQHFPRDFSEAKTAYLEGYLPCYYKIKGGMEYGSRLLV